MSLKCRKSVVSSCRRVVVSSLCRGDVVAPFLAQLDKVDASDPLATETTWDGGDLEISDRCIPHIFLFHLPSSQFYKHTLSLTIFYISITCKITKTNRKRNHRGIINNAYEDANFSFKRGRKLIFWVRYFIKSPKLFLSK